jgi:hypothetical protein
LYYDNGTSQVAGKFSYRESGDAFEKLFAICHWPFLICLFGKVFVESFQLANEKSPMTNGK